MIEYWRKLTGYRLPIRWENGISDFNPNFAQPCVVIYTANPSQLVGKHKRHIRRMLHAYAMLIKVKKENTKNG